MPEGKQISSYSTLVRYSQREYRKTATRNAGAMQRCSLRKKPGRSFFSWDSTQFLIHTHTYTELTETSK